MCDDFKNNLFQPARFHLFKTYASQALKHKSDKQPNNHLVKSETYRLVTFYILLCSFWCYRLIEVIATNFRLFPPPAAHSFPASVCFWYFFAVTPLPLQCFFTMSHTVAWPISSVSLERTEIRLYLANFELYPNSSSKSLSLRAYVLFGCRDKGVLIRNPITALYNVRTCRISIGIQTTN